MNRRVDWREQGDRDLMRSACHEAGHAIAAEHFGLNWTAEILRANHRASWGTRKYAGRVLWRPGTDFRRCVIGFAGPIAEGFCDDQNHLDVITVDDILDAAVLGQLSVTDEAAIRGHAQVRRAFTLAVKVLEDRKSDWLRIAGILRRKWWSSSYTWRHDAPFQAEATP